MEKIVKQVMTEMLAESQEINVWREIQISVDNDWHVRENNTCPICRSYPCEYQE